MKVMDSETSSTITQQVCHKNMAAALLDSFSAHLSHEMQSSIRHISIYAQLIEGQNRGRIDDEGLRHLAAIHQDVDVMRFQISRLLNFMRQSFQPVECETINLQPILANLAPQNIPSTILPAMKVSVPENEIWVKGNKTLLEQAFTILLENSVKLRCSGHSLAIAITANRETEKWMICFSDNGQGICVDEAPDLFGLFGNPSVPSAMKDSGVSMALCRHLITLQGGLISHDKNYDSGLRFSIRLNSCVEERRE